MKKQIPSSKKQIPSSNYEQLSAMDADKFQKTLTNKTTSITNRVQKKMQLR